MNTSYYASKKIDPETMKLVGISQSVPPFMRKKIRVYKPLCPPWSLIKSYKEGKITIDQYKKEYYSTVLNKLNPKEVYEELGDDAVLLCWERPDKFCHRHIVAQWLSEHLNISITEL